MQEIASKVSELGQIFELIFEFEINKFEIAYNFEPIY